MVSQAIWHPFTQHKTASAPLKVKSGRGAILELEDGREIIDAISSWWVNLHGHGHPKIAAAIYEQALRLEQVIFAGFTHEPAEKLSRKLLSHLPSHFSKIFFSDNGSTAVEVALKLAYQYWANQGDEQRLSFLCFEGAYHGDTVGAMSLGSRSLFSKPFDQLLFKVDVIPFPCIDDNAAVTQEREELSLAAIQKALEQNPRKYAAMIIEPLVQGVAGMRMCRPSFLQRVQKLIHQYDTLLIYDEVMTGFGRTGDWFACVKSNTQPDLICLAKGLTGGFLPLAVTACSDRIYDAFYSDDRMKTFFHGHSYTANPLGCAAAIASLSLLEENESLFKNMEEQHRIHYSRWIHSERIEQFRCCGTIAAMDVRDPQVGGYLSNQGPILRDICLEHGVLLRPLGNTLYIMPPYCITEEQLIAIYQAINAALTLQ